MGKKKEHSFVGVFTMIKVEDEKLFINGNLIPEASEVDKALVFNDLIIVLEGRGTQNVFCLLYTSPSPRD